MIRKAAKSDIETLIRFQQQMAMETENVQLATDTLHNGIEAMFADAGKGTYYVAEDNAKVIGCLMVTNEWSEWRNQKVWWLQSVFIEKEFRGKGVFRKMYEFLKAEISGREDIAGIRLYVEKNNVRAQKTYASLGMNGDHYTVFEWIK